MRRRGIALISVLLMTSLLLLMVLSLYISARGGLFGSVVHERQVACLNVAEAGLADAMDALETSGFALTSGPLSGTLPGVRGSWEVNFRDSGPYTPLDSVNNLSGAAAADSYRGAGSVPPHTALIVVQARVADNTRVVEAMVSRSSTGVNTNNAIQVGGTLSMAGDVEVDGIQSFDDLTEVPGNIHSNAASGTAISWDGSGSARVTGKVSSVAPGGAAIDLNGYVPEGGLPAPGGTMVPFPAVNIPALVSSKSSSPTPIIPAVGAATLGSGDFYLTGPVTINGDLDLGDSHLYVNGDLTVNGSISGTGSVHVTGDTSLQGSARIEVGDKDAVAVFSGGDVNLTGFKGSEYLETLAGLDPQAKTYLDNANLTMSEMITQLDNPSVNLYADSDLDRMRRTLGHDTATAWTYQSRPADCLGNLALRIEANQPASSPTRDFLLKKLDALSEGYHFGGTYGNDNTSLFANMPAAAGTVVADFLATGKLDGLVDAINDSTNLALAPQLQKTLDWISFDGLGSSYFRGLVYANGNVVAQNQVTVVGSLMARGNVTLSEGTRVTYVQDLFDDPTVLGMGNSLTVETWLGR